MIYILDSIWINIYNTCIDYKISNSNLFGLGIYITYFIFFYIHSWFFQLADWYGFLNQYSIRNTHTTNNNNNNNNNIHNIHKIGTRRTPPLEDQWIGLKECTIDILFIKPILLYIMAPYMLDYISFELILPSTSIIVIDIFIMEIIFSTLFYFGHVIYHKIPFLYKNIHKKHHYFHESIAFTAQYFHVFESICSICYLLLGALIIKPHYITFLIFLIFRFIEIVDAHCGYDIPWKCLYLWSDFYPWGLNGARMHDFHHSHNIGAYGGGMICWDYICGTDINFRNFEKNRIANSKSNSKSN